MIRVKVEVSARHVHLCRKDLDLLFGKEYELKPVRYLSQPGQFLSSEKVEIKNGDRTIERVSVLGPLRDKTQIEISSTDARNLRMNVPIRESGDLDNTPGCTVVGQIGKINIDSGVIVAKRHIHASTSDDIAKIFKNGDECNVKIETKDRTLIFCQTVIRISEKFSLALHIDTDEANSAGISCETFGEVLK